MHKQTDRYSVTEAIEEQENALIELIDTDIPDWIQLPPLAMVNLLKNLWTLSLSIDERKEYEFHHAVVDEKNLVPERHAAALISSAYAIADAMEVSVKFKFNNSTSGLITLDPNRKRLESEADSAIIEAPFLFSLTNPTDGTMDANQSFRSALGSVLIMQKLIEDSQSSEFILVMDDITDFAAMKFFQQSHVAMSRVLKFISDISDVRMTFCYREIYG